MHIPMIPPKFIEVLQPLIGSQTGLQRFTAIMELRVGPAPGGKYRHWDILRHLTPPGDLTSEEWWFAVKNARIPLLKPLPLADRTGEPFKYAHIDPMVQLLHQVDKNASGTIQGSELVTDPQTRNQYLFKSLVEESITSSQLEGAATTREVAKEMIRSGRTPEDRSERMIYNNYRAMQHIRHFGHQPLTPAMVLELYRILTDGTLNDPSAAGRLRRDDENIVIEDESGRRLHTPPKAAELETRLQKMCAFANDVDGQPFIHPVVRAILLHFWLAYDHPFVDGNGRTSRALFYWAMATQGYWLCEFISISRILKRAPGKYYRAFLYSETDDNDATYFVLNQLKVLIAAIEELHAYLRRKATELRQTEDLLRRSRIVKAALNHRQLAVVHHALTHPSFSYTFESHRVSHNITYQTARTDLLDLAHRKILLQKKGGRRYVFFSPPDLQARVVSLASEFAGKRSG